MLGEIASRYDGPKGVWAYDAFDAINEEYFSGGLPFPKIQWALTAHGRCLGLTKSSLRPPTITLHPSILGGTEKDNPWGVVPSWLGRAFAHDVLLHEMIHISVNYVVGPGRGSSSHNCDGWIAEVNRLAPLLGLAATMSRSKTRRIDGKVVRACDERCTPFEVAATFPYGLRDYLGTADEYYRSNMCPVPFHDDV
jgi:hypothetical protein